MSLDIYLKENQIRDEDSEELYWCNITHNLTEMADEAGIYEVLWRPDESGYIQGKDIREKVIDGFCKLLNNPEHYKKFDSDNGWGTYDDFLGFCFEYIKALNEFPESYIFVSR